MGFFEQQKEERAARIAALEKELDGRRAVALQALQAAVEAAGLTWPKHLVSIDRERSSGSSYASRTGSLTGRLRLKVGSYGNTKQFPEPKAGFDIEKIAAYVVARVRENKERNDYARQCSAIHQVNAAVAKQINTDLGATIGGPHAESTEVAGKVRLCGLDMCCDEATARRVLAAIRDVLATKAEPEQKD
jgi:hypothetical protein